MSFLMKMMEKAGLVVASAPNATPGQKVAEIQITRTRVVSLREIVAPEVTQVSGPKGFKATPADVFAAAKLEPPANGWTVEKFRELAAKPLYRDMSQENRQKALLAELATNSADPAAIVADAVRKDEALDAYERFLTQKLAQTKKDAAAKKEKLIAEVAALETMEKATAAEFEAWRAAKVAKEKELAEALAPLMADGKITQS